MGFSRYFKRLWDYYLWDLRTSFSLSVHLSIYIIWISSIYGYIMCNIFVYIYCVYTHAVIWVVTWFALKVKYCTLGVKAKETKNQKHLILVRELLKNSPFFFLCTVRMWNHGISFHRKCLAKGWWITLWKGMNMVNLLSHGALVLHLTLKNYFYLST